MQILALKFLDQHKKWSIVLIEDHKNSEIKQELTESEHWDETISEAKTTQKHANWSRVTVMQYAKRQLVFICFPFFFVNSVWHNRKRQHTFTEHKHIWKNYTWSSIAHNTSHNNRSTKCGLCTSSCFASSFTGYLYCCYSKSCPWIVDIFKFSQTLPWFCISRTSWSFIIQKWGVIFLLYWLFAINRLINFI